MKLLLLSHAAGPYGAERVLLAMAAGLAARGHDVTLALPHAGPAADAARGLAEIRVRVGRRRPLPRTAAEAIRYFLGGPRDVTAARRLVREVAPDAVWVNSMYNPWAAIGARLAGVPVIWHLHERRLPAPLGPLIAALIGAVASRAVVISDYVARGFGAFPWLRGRIRMVRNPLLDPLAPAPPPPERPFTVGYLGQLEPRKRAPDVARAIASLPGVRAVFVGDGKARNALEEAVRLAGIGERVELLGFLPDGAAELARFDCLAIPSLREPFGLVALEAMAAGVPVVAARSGALPEVLGDAALYHRPRDAADLGRQIARLRSEPALRDDLRERGLHRVADFRRDRWLDAIEGVLGEVAALRAQPE